MIRAKVQLFDDSTGKNIGEQKIVSPKAYTFWFLPNKEATVEFEFDFNTEDPANLFDDISLDDMEGSFIKT